MFSDQSHTYFKTRRWISCLILLTFLFSDVARAQGLEKPSTLNPYEEPRKTREEGFVSLEEFEVMEAREKFLEEQRQNLQLLRRESEVRNQKLIEEQNKSLQEAMELQKLIEQQKGMNIRGKADEIKSRISQAGERYILYKDGKKVTFKGGLTIKVENEKVKDKLGNVSIRNTVDMQYDKKNQLVSYNQETKDPLGNVTRVEWRSGTYWTKADQAADPLKVAGKLSGYSETIYEPTGLVTTRNWSQIRHYTKETEKLNPAHVADQLASYRVESVGNDAPAATRVTEFSNAQYMRRPATPTATDIEKEDDILLTKFHEKSTMLGVTTQRDFFDAQYNEHEQLVSYRETSTTMGVTTEKEWKNATYDELGRLKSFDEITKTEGVTTVRHFREAQYNSLGQLISYTEVRSTQGLTTITKFSDATYDQFGRLSSYKNVITENGVTYTQIRKEIEYNAQGQVTGYFDIVERLGMTTETRRSNITYDAFGRMFSYIDQIHEFGGGLDRTIKVVREQTQYNKLGQELGYKETIYEPNGLIREVARSNQKYNALGQLVSFYEVVRERGSVQQMVAVLDAAGNVMLDSNGNPMTRLEMVAIDRTIQRYFRNAGYDGLGRLVSYEEEVRDSTRPGVVVVRQRWDQVYDGQGRVVSYKERETTTGTVSDAQTSQLFILNHTQLRERTQIVYNALGQELSYFERLIDASGAVTERYLLDAQYDSAGRMAAYKERVTANGVTITRERSQIIFDSKGREVSYLEVSSDAAGVTITTFRKSTRFNVIDLPVEYLEEVRTSADPNEVETIHFVNGVYDELQRLISYTTETTSLLSAFKDVTTRESTSFNSAGQVAGFAEGRMRYYQSELVSQEHLTRANSVYNAQGALTAYDEVLDRTWLKGGEELTVSQDRLTTLFRDGVYDEAGRLLSYREEERHQVTGEIAKNPEIRNWTRNYTFNCASALEDNFLFYGSPSWSLVDGDLVWDTLVADPTKSNYLTQGISLGESQGYTLEIALQVEEVAATGGQVTLFWKGSENGEYFYFREGSLVNGVTGKVYATATSDAVHTYRFTVKNGVLRVYKDGVLLGTEGIGNYRFSGFQEPLIVGNGGTRSRIRSLRYFAGDAVELGTARESFTQETLVKRVRTNSYDLQGRLAQWVEGVSHSAEPGVATTTTLSNITYDSQNRQTGYLQTTARSSTQDPALLNLTETVARSAITYDSKNRLVSYHEEQKSSAASGKTVEVDRSAIQYNDRGDVAGYAETAQEINAGGKTFQTEQGVDLTYDNFGDLAVETTVEKVTAISVMASPQGEESASEKLLSVTRRVKSGALLDPFGVERHSVMTEEDLTEAYQSSEYNAGLRQLGGSVAALNPPNPFAGYVTDFDFINDGTINGARDGSYINNGGSVTLTLPQAVKASKVELGFYLGANQIGNAYRVEVSSDGINFETVANQGISEILGPQSHTISFLEKVVKAVRFTATSAVGSGGTFYLSEISVPVARPEPNKANIKEAVAQLDSLGLKAKYTSTARVTRQTNPLGQVVSETQILTKRREGETVETTRTVRSNQGYNALGQVVSLHEETSTVATTWSSFRNLYFYLTNPYPLSVNHYLYNYIGTPQSFDYNGHGHYVGLGYLAPKSWDIYQSSDRSEMTYNGVGQLVGYIESGVSRPFGGSYSLTRSDTQYNDRGEVTSIKESGQTQSSGSYNFTRDQMVYGTTAPVIASPEGAKQSPAPPAAALISYHETGTNPQSGPYELTHKVNQFDSRGRPVEVEENGVKNAAPYHYKRTGITYNANEMPFSWKETGVQQGSTYDVARVMTRYNNMGQQTDYLEQGVRAGSPFWEIISETAYDYLGRFFKNQTRSGPTQYTYTYDGTRAFTFYDSEGRVSAYQNYFGPVFIDVTGIQYDSFGRIIAYTETVRGGATRQIFGIVYDAQGRVISQKVIDSGAGLLFGDVSTYTFSYDLSTGKLLETRIENNDYTLLLDENGDQKSLTLSERLKAYLSQLEARAKESARERRRSTRSADGRFAPDGAKVLSRTEKVDKKTGGKRVTEVFEVTNEEGRKHKVRESRTLDAAGSLLGRQTVDNFSFRNERGKKIRARIASFFDGENRLTKTVEKYKQRLKGGTQITKRVTDYDPSGNILRQKEKTSFKKSGFFNSTAGKIVGALIIAAVSVISMGTLAPYLGPIGALAFGAGVGQTAVSMLQGASFKQAITSGLISAAAVIATAGLAKVINTPMVQQLFAPFKNAFKLFSTNLTQNLFGQGMARASATAGATAVAAGSSAARNQLITSFAKQVLTQASFRMGVQQFESSFGKKIGVFGTAAILSFATAVGGAYANNNFSPGIFAKLGPEGLTTLAIRALAQGAIAEGFKNKQGYGAQFLRETLSLSTVGLDTKVIGQTASAISNVVNTQIIQPIGKATSEIGKIFDPRTEAGRDNIKLAINIAPGSITDGTKQRYIDPSGRVFILNKGSVYELDESGRFMHAASSSSRSGFLNIYDRGGNLVGVAPELATPLFRNNEYVGSSYVQNFGGERVLMLFDSKGKIIGTSPNVDRGDGINPFTMQRVDYLGETPNKGVLTKFLTRQDPESITQFNQLFPENKVKVYYPESYETSIGEANSLFRRRNLLEFTYFNGGPEKWSELMINFMAGSTTSLSDAAGPITGPYNNPNRVNDIVKIRMQNPADSKLYNAATALQGSLENLATAMDRTIALQSYKIVVSRPGGLFGQNEVTVYKPSLAVEDTFSSNSKYSNNSFNPTGIKYEPLPPSEAAKYLKDKFGKELF